MNQLFSQIVFKKSTMKIEDPQAKGKMGNLVKTNTINIMRLMKMMNTMHNQKKLMQKYKLKNKL
jgi:hypothetical protein